MCESTSTATWVSTPRQLGCLFFLYKGLIHGLILPASNDAQPTCKRARPTTALSGTATTTSCSLEETTGNIFANPFASPGGSTTYIGKERGMRSSPPHTWVATRDYTKPKAQLVLSPFAQHAEWQGRTANMIHAAHATSGLYTLAWLNLQLGSPLLLRDRCYTRVLKSAYAYHLGTWRFRAMRVHVSGVISQASLEWARFALG